MDLRILRPSNGPEAPPKLPRSFFSGFSPPTRQNPSTFLLLPHRDHPQLRHAETLEASETSRGHITIPCPAPSPPSDYHACCHLPIFPLPQLGIKTSFPPTLEPAALPEPNKPPRSNLRQLLHPENHHPSLSSFKSNFPPTRPPAAFSNRELKYTPSQLQLYNGMYDIMLSLFKSIPISVTNQLPCLCTETCLNSWSYLNEYQKPCLLNL